MHHLCKQNIIGAAELLLTVPLSLTASVLTCFTDLLSYYTVSLHVSLFHALSCCLTVTCSTVLLSNYPTITCLTGLYSVPLCYCHTVLPSYCLTGLYTVTLSYRHCFTVPLSLWHNVPLSYCTILLSDCLTVLLS